MKPESVSSSYKSLVCRGSLDIHNISSFGIREGLPKISGIRSWLLRLQLTKKQWDILLVAGPYNDIMFVSSGLVTHCASSVVSRPRSSKQTISHLARSPLIRQCNGLMDISCGPIDRSHATHRRHIVNSVCTTSAQGLCDQSFSTGWLNRRSSKILPVSEDSTARLAM